MLLKHWKSIAPIVRHILEVLTYKLNALEFSDVAKCCASLTFGLWDCTAARTGVVVEQYTLAVCLYVVSDCCI
jgi:hypothetical protein